MKFPALEIENFLAITKAKLNLSDRGLVLIQGSNLADTSATSNGAGKSSIADALCWCWYGTTARGLAGDDVINWDAKKGTFVRSVAVDGHLTYTATRYRKHKIGKNSFTLSVNDGLVEKDLTKGTDKLTQIEAEKVLGASLEVFVGSIYAGQEKMPDLPGMTDKQLKLLIEEAAGVSQLEAAYEIARKNLALAQTDLQMTQSDLGNKRSRLAMVNTNLGEIDKMSEQWKVDNKASIDAVMVEIQAILPVVKINKAELEAKDVAGLEAKIKACDDKIAAVTSEQAELRRLTGVASSASTAHTMADATVKRLQREVVAATAAVNQVEHKIGCPCDECGRPLTKAELADATKAAEDRLVQKKAELDTALKAEVDALDAYEAAGRARDEYAAKMTDTSAVAAQRALLQKELDSIRQLQATQDTLMQKVRGLKQRLDTLKAEKDPSVAHRERLTSHKELIEKEVAEVEAKAAREEDRVNIETEVVKIFAPSGVRSLILDDVTPFLNGQTSKYLATLSDGNIEAIWTTLTPNSKGELKEKFSIDVSNAKGGKSFKGISGGEKRKVRIAAALALQDLVATRASKPIELFIGDEIDDALDAAGLERLMMVLEEKACDRGSVFVISHNELRDMIKQVVIVEKKPDLTTEVREIAA